LAKTPSNKKQPDLVLGRLANHHAECGHLYSQNNLPHDAINEYKRALSMYEKMPDVKIALGQVYFRTNQLDRALYEFQDAVRMFPDEYEAHLWLGVCLWKLDRREQAVRSWETSRNLDDTSGLASAYLEFSQKTPRSK
jgi:tetratricopeptide (TPR) repeat protein